MTGPPRQQPHPPTAPAAPGTSGFDAERRELARWHELVARGQPLRAEAAIAVTAALHGTLERDGLPGPLLPLPDMSDYVTVHALNVALLAMALARRLGHSPGDVRDLGVAALLHDVGMVTVPLSLLRKPEQLEPDERELIKRHPLTGAALILAGEPALPLAAVVAFEHHRRADGGGYPPVRWDRAAHYASRLVQVCDVFAALSTPRPFRQAWPEDVILSFLSSRAGVEFDAELARAFGELVRAGGR